MRYLENYSSFYISMICYIAKYVEEGNVRKACLDLKHVPGASRRFFKEVKNNDGGEPTPMAQLLEELQRDMNSHAGQSTIGGWISQAS